MNLHVDIIAHNSEAYRQAVALRYRILREPLGLGFTPEQLAAEADCLHLAAFADGQLVGILLLEPQESGVVKMRQVAVAESQQRQGIGRTLVTFAETVARQHGYTSLILNARIAVLPFYAKLGYTSYGEPFIEVTLPHQLMRKTL